MTNITLAVVPKPGATIPVKLSAPQYDNPDTVAPTVPGSVAATVVDSTVTVTWTASTDASSILKYRVFRDGVFRSDDIASPYVETNVPPGTYVYSVSAVDGSINANESARGSAAAVIVRNPLLSDGLEDGTLNAWTQELSGSSGATWTIVVGAAASGMKYLRTELAYLSALSYRAMQILKGSELLGVEGGVLYYGISIRVPTTTVDDPISADSCCQFNPGGAAHWALRNNNGVWDFDNHNFAAGGNTDLGAITKGVWHRWIVRFRWSTTTNGSVKVWHDPVSEATTPVHQASNIQTLSPTYTGIATYKVGCYKPDWSVAAPDLGMSPRVYHHDNAKIGLTFLDVL